jgi:hypothetical protein
MYNLTYEMMVQTLRQFAYTGEAHAEIPARSALKGGGRAVLVVQNGNLTGCFIFNKGKQKLYDGMEAQQMLTRLNVLDWNLVSPSPSPAGVRSYQPATPSQAAKEPDKRSSFCPHRLVLSQSQMRTWSPLHRSVYFLADGKHTIEQIAILLSCSQQAVEQAIQDLQIIGGIDRLR